jgi:hypothetical protein
MMTIRILAASLLGIMLAGCGNDSESPPVPSIPASVERQIAPKSTDPAIDINLEPHIAINPSPSVAASGRLFVFLPGTGALPTHYRLILRTGAARGYHAIGLNYPNDDAVGILCDTSADQDCQWKVRREIITGIDTSPLVDVNAANSIVNRLQKALSYLHAQFPNEGWGQYLADGGIDWSRVEVAGHSQGGGHAAAIAKFRAVFRAVYFASPADWNTSSDAPPAWISQSGATDASRQYGFTHTQDATVPFAHLAVTWQALGLGAFGAPVSVESAGPPYDNSRQLTTDAAPRPGGAGLSPYHAAPVLDAATPLTGSDEPLYAPVWIYLCFP